MIKRFLSVLLVLAFSVTMFTFTVSAEETITIYWSNDSESYSVNSNYSPYTLPGTKLVVSAQVDLGDNQEIQWVLNGNVIGTSTNNEKGYVENYSFESVEGTNSLQAIVVEGENVVATSNIIEKTFKPIVKSGSDLFANDLTAADSTKWYYGSQGDVTSYVADPAGSGRNVFKIDKPAATSYTEDLLRIKAKSNSDYFTSSDTGSGIIRIDYSIYAQNDNDKIALAYLHIYDGASTTKRPFLYADDYSTEDGSVIAGADRSRKSALPQGRWVDVSIVLDNSSKVYDVTVDGVQATTRKAFCSHDNCTACYLRSFTLPCPISKTGDLVYYLKDVKIYKCTEPTISVAPVCANAKAIAGSKLVVNTESSFENASIEYYCNGVKYTDNKVLASAGTNTVYAQAIGESGNILGTSEPVTFEAYGDEFNETYKLTTATPNESGYVRTSNLFRGATTIERLYYQSVDVDLENLAKESTFGITFGHRMGSENAEKWPKPFVFTSDSINIATAFESNMVTTKESISIPRVAGQNVYNLKVIYDPLYGSYLFLLDDVLYSVIDVSATSASYPSNTSANAFGFMYLQVEADTPVTLSNYSVGYSAFPEALSTVDYINNEKIVANTNELTNADDLTVRFVAYKGEFEEVFCVATVLEEGGELVSLATQNVTFDETNDSQEVVLELKNLPSDIASGNYTVNVMLWNKDDLKPIVSKIVMP